MAAAKPKIQLKPFTMVRRALWSSQRFVALPDDATRYLYLYFLTGPHQTASGCFVAKTAYLLADLAMPGSDWTPATLADRKGHLAKSGLILGDEATDETLVTRWWKDNGPGNPSWFQGARKQCEAIQSQELREAAQASLDECWANFQAQNTQSPATGREYLRAVSSRLPSFSNRE